MGKRDAKLPKSRLGRLARMAALGTRMSARKVAGFVGDRDAESKLASAAADALGNMRGLALKMGQMASYVDGMVPADHRDTYEDALRGLRAAAPTMTDAEARGVFEAELGAAPEALLAHFEASPFASASIGQVHRATTKDGADVVVKIQFEGIGDAVRSDLDNASLMSAFLGPIGTKIGAKDQLAEVRARFLEELDYRHEAAAQARFAAAFEGHPTVRIPTVLEPLSATRVLTSTFAPGAPFDTARAASEDARRAYAETLWTFVFGSLLQHGLFNADPHPGNYLFGDDGVVHFLDYGCTRTLSAESLERVVACHRAATDGDIERLCDTALDMFELPSGGLVGELSRAYVARCFEPISNPKPTRITRDFAASLLTGMRDNVLKVVKARESFTPMPAEWAFFNRLQLGFYSVLARLDVAVDYRRLDASLLP